MSVQTYNPMELRYAIGDLATHRFVTEEDYNISRDYSREMLIKVISHVQENTKLKIEVMELKEENEILRAERSHWHHMYNNNLDERLDN